MTKGQVLIKRNNLLGSLTTAYVHPKVTSLLSALFYLYERSRTCIGCLLLHDSQLFYLCLINTNGEI